MTNQVIIVESPNKIKKIQSFVGNDYNVTASMGHIRNIDPKQLGIDIEKSFTPNYIVTDDKKKVVSQLKKLVDKNTIVWLATDLDREGEAISWHLSEVLKLPKERRKRIVFTEITKKAILSAMEKPGDIDMNKFYAQQARMVLDKLIGYKICPILWKKYMNFKLSAGRVQSVVVKIIEEREKEIENFSANSYFKLTGGFNLKKNTNQKGIDNLKLDKKENKKISEFMNEIENEVELNTESDNKIVYVEQILALNKMLKKKNIEFKISSLKVNTTKRKPQTPYITSTLQQDASNKLGMSPQVCMSCAQKLYEAGLITYMRTDSLMLANDALDEIKNYVVKTYGKEYHKLTKYASKSKNAQEAHEACRPTKISTIDVFGKDGITSQQNRLYKMIWKRTVASQMTPADIEIKTIKIVPEFKDNDFDIDMEVFNKKQEDIFNTENKIKEVSDNNNPNKGVDTYKEFSKSDIVKDIRNLVFIGKHEKVLFEGFLKVMGNFKGADIVNTSSDKKKHSNDIGNEEDEENDTEESELSKKSKLEKSEKIAEIFSKLKEGDKVKCFYLNSEEKFTKPPHGRFTEASLIKRLDELEIGRPSTYAAMVNKVQDRNYVEKKTTKPEKKDIKSFTYLYMNGIFEETKKINVGGDKNKLFPTPLGRMVNSFLVDKFDNLLDYGFTAKIEALLDDVEKGDKIWYKVVQTFYDTMQPIIETLILNGGVADADKEKMVGDDDEYSYKVINARYGPVIARVNKNNVKNITYASLCGPPDKLTLNTAEKCFMFPMELGKYKNKIICLCRSKNYYLKYDNKSYSIDNYNTLALAENKDASTIIINDVLLDNTFTKYNIEPTYILSLEHAINVIDFHNSRSEGKTISKDIVIKYGKYGPYIKYKNDLNVPIPYKLRSSLDSLTKEICMDAIEKKLLKEKKKTMTKDELNELKKEKKKEKDAINKEKKLGQIRKKGKPVKKQRVNKTIDEDVEKIRDEEHMSLDDPIINNPIPKKGRKKTIVDIDMNSSISDSNNNTKSTKSVGKEKKQIKKKETKEDLERLNPFNNITRIEKKKDDKK
jgi:DNA topoisomerase I